MKNVSQLLVGLLTAIGSTALVLAAASLALLEGGVTAVSVAPTVIATETLVFTTSTPQEIPTITVTPLVTATITPTEESSCKDTPADWVAYTVQQDDTIATLVVKSGVSTAEFLKANCFKSDSVRLEPGWVVYLPPTAPTATATLTQTPELPTPTLCGPPPGWVNYIVQPGDTLFRLSLVLGISQNELMTANCLTGITIYAGQILHVPHLPPVPTRTPTPTRTAEPSDTPVPPTPGKNTATVTLNIPSPVTYDGSPHGATATTTPSGLTVIITYNGSTTPPTNAGTYTVIATVDNANYVGSATGTLVINQAQATVTLNIPSPVTYNQNPHQATATTNPTGLNVIITYNGSGTPPTDAGTYTVIGAVDNTNYTGSATGTLVINQAPATVTLNIPSPVTYDGSSHGATATTTPSGLNVIITYDGSTTPPTDAGSYTVTATVDNANYTGSATGTLVINQAQATITLNIPSPVTYDGNPHGATATTVPPGLTVTIRYDDTTDPPTNPGTYHVTAIIDNANYMGTATGTLVINQAPGIR